MNLHAMTVQSSSLRGYAEIVSELGGDPEAWIRTAFLPPEALTRDDLALPVIAVGTLLEVTSKRLNCPDLGLRLSAHQDESVLGPLALALQNAATASEALDLASRYLRVHSQALALAVVPDPELDLRRFGITLSIPMSRFVPQTVDLGIGLIHRACQSIGKTIYRPLEVRFSHPPLVAVEVYQQYFNVPVSFRHPQPMIVADSDGLDRPIAGSDSTLRDRALAHLRRQRLGQLDSVTADARVAIEGTLGIETLTLRSCAELMGIHERTLQRRLASEGQSWESLIAEVRQERVYHLLTETSLPLSHVSAQVGFAEQSALTRASRRWWGLTPSAVRNQGLTDACLYPHPLPTDMRAVVKKIFNRACSDDNGPGSTAATRTSAS